MKKLLIILSVVLYGCGDNIKRHYNPEDVSFGIQTISHDECEYVIYKDGSNGSIQMLHKITCKYCYQRANPSKDSTFFIKGNIVFKLNDTINE